MKNQGTSKGWAYILLSMMLIGFALTLIGCKGKQIVTESAHSEYLIKEIHDTLWMDRLVYIIDSTHQATSIHERDCTVVKQDAQGNIIGTDRWHLTATNKELSHSKEKFDSAAYYRSVIDSLRRIVKNSKDNKAVIEKQSFTGLISDLMTQFIIAIILVVTIIIIIRYKCR